MVNKSHLVLHTAPSAYGGGGGMPVYKRLTFIHIPKTGGTSIMGWASREMLDLEEPRKLHCNTSRFDRSRQRPAGATSVKHCVNRYEATAADPNEVGFCVVREPIARAVSSFNMRHPGFMAQRCHPEAYSSALQQFVARGDVDNHHVAQSDFAKSCTFVLCFDTLVDDVDSLLAQTSRVSRTVWTRLVMMRRLVDTRPRLAATLRRQLPKHISKGYLLTAARAFGKNFSSMPLVRPWTVGVPSACNVSHVRNRTRLALLAKYANDSALYAATCAGSDRRQRWRKLIRNAGFLTYDDHGLHPINPAPTTGDAGGEEEMADGHEESNADNYLQRVKSRELPLMAKLMRYVQQTYLTVVSSSRSPPRVRVSWHVR